MRYKNLSQRRKLIFALDLLLFLLFVLSQSPRLTGLPLHELTGAFLFLPIITHTLVEWRWLVNYIRRFFKTATVRDKFNLLLNVSLFITLAFEIISGLVISQVFLPFLHIKTINDARWRFWHNQMATLAMFLTGLHLALSWNRIVFYFRKRTTVVPRKKLRISINVKRSLYGVFILCLVTVMVAMLALLLIGKPSIERQYTGNEIARFRPTVFHGIFQFVAETFLVITTCIIARRWLKVRL